MKTWKDTASVRKWPFSIWYPTNSVLRLTLLVLYWTGQKMRPQIVLSKINRQTCCAVFLLDA